MTRSLAPRSAALVLLLALLGGCGLVEPSGEERLTLFVAPVTVECMGMMPQRCLLVKERPEQEWSYFYDSIEGFTHEPGFSYTLRVLRRVVPDPPADASSFEYRLLRVLSREPAPAG